ncbi:hypothetical protein HPP92_013697 [Vanilla planifolia]|uniref:Plant heme peroxidase family profile domain-containing protein n=1 Tax=Vanilla planifolia TaxID=51239 RepID=A0A835QW22_VANPL|nr:hypothetical protein HPP92_013697 [Vanilla planifolia]
MNRKYAAALQAACPPDVDPSVVIPLDPTTPITFDNNFYVALQNGMGLLTSDQTLFTDQRSRPTVNSWAANPQKFYQKFVLAMTRMGRVGVKTDPRQGNIRRDCSVLN